MPLKSPKIKIMGFMVMQCRIEANPKKIHAILEMKHSSSKKEVEYLIRRIVALKEMHFFLHGPIANKEL